MYKKKTKDHKINKTFPFHIFKNKMFVKFLIKIITFHLIILGKVIKSFIFFFVIKKK